MVKPFEKEISLVGNTKKSIANKDKIILLFITVTIAATLRTLVTILFISNV